MATAAEIGCKLLLRSWVSRLLLFRLAGAAVSGAAVCRLKITGNELIGLGDGFAVLAGEAANLLDEF